jgi:hypothetical protein
VLKFRGAVLARGARLEVRYSGRQETFMKALKPSAALFAASMMMVWANAGASTADAVLPDDLDKGLIGLWHLDGDAHDSSGNGHDGVVHGAKVVAGGVSGSAYSFDGTARITVGNLDFSGESYSVNIWLQTDRAAVKEDWRMPINKADAGAGNQTFQILLGDGRTGIGGNAPMMQVWQGAGTLVNESVGANSNINSRDGQWHMATITYVRGRQILYVDGCPASYGHYSGALPLVSGEVTFAGSEGLTFHHPWIGNLDEVSIYSRELSRREVLRLYRMLRPSGGCGSASQQTLSEVVCRNLTASTSVSALISRTFWNCAGLSTGAGDVMQEEVSGTAE